MALDRDRPHAKDGIWTNVVLYTSFRAMPRAF